jgi:stalled ribosome alternative rescue factor ArfA
LLRNSTNNFDDEDIKNQLFNSRKKKKKKGRGAPSIKQNGKARPVV